MYELASLFVLVFALHEDLWEYGSDWCIGLHKDEEMWTYEGWQFCNEGYFVGFWGKQKKGQIFQCWVMFVKDNKIDIV